MQFFDPTVLLFMAGFSIGAVLEKQRISNMIASVLLRPFGNKPENVMLGIMSLGMFLSMWISNVPSSVLLPIRSSSLSPHNSVSRISSSPAAGSAVSSLSQRSD